MSLELKFQAGFETERQGCKRSDTVKYSFVLYVLQKTIVRKRSLGNEGEALYINFSDFCMTFSGKCFAPTNNQLPISVLIFIRISA